MTIIKSEVWYDDALTEAVFNSTFTVQDEKTLSYYGGGEYEYVSKGPDGDKKIIKHNGSIDKNKVDDITWLSAISGYIEVNGEKMRYKLNPYHYEREEFIRQACRQFSVNPETIKPYVPPEPSW